MTTTFFLVRHAVHEQVSTTLCGRTPGVRLGEEGKMQARSLARRFEREDVTAIYTSPLERATETAEPIARCLGKPLEVCHQLTEIDFGEWTGLSFEALLQDERWMIWNNLRIIARPPGGEMMLEAQARIVTMIEELCRRHPDRSIVLVSHGDMIKGALLFYLGLSFDACSRIEIDPASISIIVRGNWGSKILVINERITS